MCLYTACRGLHSPPNGMALRQDGRAVAQQLEGCTELTDLRCDDSCVTVRMRARGQASSPAKSLVLAMHFMDIDSYPYCSCLALCEVRR